MASEKSSSHKVGQDNIKTNIGPFGLDIHNPVFLISGLSVVAFVLITLFRPEEATSLFGNMRMWVTNNFSWFFLLSGNIFVLFCLFLIVSPLGKIRLGGKDATPDFSIMAWFSMLFAAGMGIGLIFFGVAEPISHFGAAFADGAGGEGSWSPLAGAAGDTKAAQSLAMAATIYHWGLNPWAMYGVVGVSLAFFSYNKGLPLSIRSAFYPIFGEAVWGWVGHVIDILAVFATLFGLATSLGLGAEQANAGLHYLFPAFPVTSASKVFLILVITAIALGSVLAGLNAGIRRASQFNMVLAAILLLFVLLAGPTLELISGFFTNLWAYATEYPKLAQPFGRSDANFSQGWTSFYWAWWISWSPFVGMFIARVSKGRTVRQFMVSVLLIPSLVCALWMTVFGGTALSLINSGVASVADASLELKLFALLGELPLANLTSFVGIVLVIVFFVTSSDSGSLVVDTITAGGKTDGPIPQRVFWCVFEGLVAIALLIGGGLAALQAMAVTTGFPFGILLVLMCLSVYLGMRKEKT